MTKESHNNIVCREEKPAEKILKGRRGPEPLHGNLAAATYERIFWTSSQAADQGYLSKTQWKKRKRQPLPDAPKAMVIRKTGLVSGWTFYPVLEYREDGSDVAVLDWWEAIHRRHTVPLGDALLNTLSQAVPSLPLVNDSLSGSDSPLNTKCLSVPDSASASISVPAPASDGHLSSSNALSASPSLIAETSVSSSNLKVQTDVLILSPSSSTTPTPSLNTTIERRREEERDGLPYENRDFWIINSREKPLTNIGAFVPENFAKEDEAQLAQYLQEAYCIFHNLHLFRVRTRQPKDAWIDLSYQYCDERFPNWRRLRCILLDGILERIKADTFPELGIVIPRGVKGGRCYGYRFRKEEYRHARVRKRAITDPELAAWIESHRNVKYPVQRWLEKNLSQVEIEGVSEERLMALAGQEQDKYWTYREQVELIQDKSWVFVADDFSRRIHTNLTGIKRELRACLRVAGRPLVQIDIKNSQPLFIALAARRVGIEDARYIALCQDDLYQYLGDLGGWTRNQVKEQLTQAALFAPNGSPHQRLPVKQLFDTEFPTIARFISGMKAERKSRENPKPHNKLARSAQRLEANFVIYGMSNQTTGVCNRIRKERPECWVSTIHDSVLTLPETAEYVRDVMLDEFGRVGVHPRLTIEPCDK